MKKLKTSLYLDDVRTPTETIPGYNPWNVVRNYNEFREYILRHGIPDLISFDHDLADEHATDYFNQVAVQGYQHPDYASYKEKTGLDCAKWLCEEYFRTADRNIQLKQVGVHSHNPVGAKNIQDYINGFKKHMDWTPDCFLMKHPFEIIKGSN